jgi:hypothetical protein
VLTILAWTQRGKTVAQGESRDLAAKLAPDKPEGARVQRSLRRSGVSQKRMQEQRRGLPWLHREVSATDNANSRISQGAAARGSNSRVTTRVALFKNDESCRRNRKQDRQAIPALDDCLASNLCGVS